MAAEFRHPIIGSIKASTSKQGLVQFLGLRYASLEDRFAPPKSTEYDGHAALDASQHGPQTLTIPNGADFEFKLLQHALEYDRNALTMSDTNGLNLNITVPADAAMSQQRLPVFTFIHGGGFFGGSASYPQYDLARFVRLSVNKGMPVIAVGLNYRLGAPGMLTSKEMRNAGYLPNNSLRDQRTALLWIQKHIEGFGGNPEEVTLMGESAGGVSATYHLHSKEPLFKRVMCMSGTSLLESPRPMESAEVTYAQAIKALGLEDLSPADRIEALTDMDMEQLRDQLMKAGFSGVPVMDGDLCPVEVTYRALEKGELDLPGRLWCEGMIQGDCQFDGSIQAGRLMGRKAGIATSFCKAVRGTLQDRPDVATTLLANYDIRPDMEDDEAMLHIMEFSTDLHWYVPTVEFAEYVADDMPVYMYRFNSANPWPGPNQGRAPHIMDLIALLQNFNEFMDDRQRALSAVFAEQVLRFVYGRDPWRMYKLNPVDDGRASNVFGANGTVEVQVDLASLTGRRGHLFPLGKSIGFDRLKDAWNAFFTGPS